MPPVSSWNPYDRVDWPRDNRDVRFPMRLEHVPAWFVAFPVGVLATATLVLSIHDVVFGHGWLRFVRALVGVSLGGLIGWKVWRGLLRFLLALVASERVVVCNGVVRLRLRGDDLGRSDVTLVASSFTSVLFSPVWGETSEVWLEHRDGPLLLLATLPAADARTLWLKLSVEGNGPKV